MKRVFCFIICLILLMPIGVSASTKIDTCADLDKLFETKIVDTPNSEFDKYILSKNNNNIDFEKLSSEELLDATLKFEKLNFIVSLYSDPVSGIKAVRKYCPVFNEFLKRRDCVEILEERIKNIDEVETEEQASFLTSLAECTFSNPDSFPIGNIWYHTAYQQNDSNNPVKTPKNFGIKVHLPERMLTQNEIEACRIEIQSIGGLTYISPASSKYNCHNYAWAANPYKKEYWMADPCRFFSTVNNTPPGYEQDDNPSVGTKVVYYDASVQPKYIHSGTIVQMSSSYLNYMIESKWGQQPVVKHSYANCPYFSDADCPLYFDTTQRVGIKKFQRYINVNLPSQYLGSTLAIDAGFGPASKTAAIKLLQYWLNRTYNAGLTVDGGFGNMTYNACVTLAQGDSGMGVYILQGLLYAKGYDPRGFDGSFGVSGGTGCLEAVKAFQRANGLTVDGRAGKNTFRALCS